jgi:capsular polysaccharide export protein
MSGIDNPRDRQGSSGGMNHGQAQAALMFGKVLRHPHLGAFLRENAPDGTAVHVGWGMKASGRSAMRAAAKSGGRLLLLEDAFVRSLRPGSGGAVYGLLADSRGIHYHADGQSDLIRALQSGKPCGWMRKSPVAGDVPEKLMTRFRELGVSKYNWFPGEYAAEAPAHPEGILVVDQTRGDMAIRLGGLDEGAFGRMLRAALDESDGAPVYLRGHPDHLFRSRKSCFPRELLDDRRIRLLPADLSPAQCFAFCRTVFVGSSLLGMEALLHGCRVVTFGAPFYAGWGLTEDRLVRPRGRSVDLAELFDLAYLRYCHYFDPDTGEPCGLASVLEHLALQKEMFRRNRGRAVSVGFSPWKRDIAPSYLRSPAGSLVQLSSLDDLEKFPADEETRLVLWGRKQEVPARFAGRCSRVEDGFIRSKGLGAAFNFPYSWVVDDTGIYFDASAPSDLEVLLEGGFSEADLATARELAALLREKRLTKYNLTGNPVSLDPGLVRGRRVLLVPGQVEADASILFGSPELKSNLDLLRRVRECEPDACIVFKAHPDLVAGARHGKVLPPGYAEACDLAVTEGNVLDWLDLCDEVHTMTSTVGFEALIRGVPVTTYGLPFYAGWGLTKDRLSCPRRKRRLTLDELVCGALIRYPRYLNPATGEFTTALKVTHLLTSPDAAGDRRAWHLKCLSKAKKLWVNLSR